MKETKHTFAIAGSRHVARWAQTCAMGCAIIAALSAGFVHGYTNPSVSNPITSPTVPPSSVQNDLVSTPNPMDTSGNLVVTGNVSGGKHFRGAVPYRSTTGFGAPLGSSSLDSFLRYSAAPDAGGSPSGAYSPFYSPTGTVTRMEPGQRRVLTPGQPTLPDGSTPSPIRSSGRLPGSAEVSQLQVLPDINGSPDSINVGMWQQLGPSPAGTATGPASPRLWDELAVPASEPRPVPQAAPAPARALTPDDYQRQWDQLQRELEGLNTDAIELEQSLRPEDRRVQNTVQESYADDLETIRPGQSLTQRLGSRPAAPAPSPLLSNDPQTELGLLGVAPPRSPLLEPPLSQAQRDVQEIDRLFSPQTPDSEPADMTDSASQRIADTSRAFDTPSTFLKFPSTLTTSPSTRDTTSTIPATQSQSQLGNLGIAPKDHSAELMDRLRANAGSVNRALEPTPPAQPEDLAETPPPLIGDRALQQVDRRSSYSQEQYDRHLKAADLYMQQGQYPRAADAFTLAAAYQPKAAAAALGKSHATLAIGDYVTSALALAKAIEVDPAQALHRVNLVRIAGGPDAFIHHFNTLDQQVRETGSAHMQFLLAYVYFQMGRQMEARIAIDAACKALPSSTAAGLLQAAINP